jgi:hypothetical protein
MEGAAQREENASLGPAFSLPMARGQGMVEENDVCSIRHSCRILD